MKNRLWSVLLALIVLILPLSCSAPGQSDQLKVVVTILPQADLVRGIAGDGIDITVLVPPGQDPHMAQLHPGQMVSVSQAKAYFIVGSGLEFEEANLERIIEQNPQMLIVNLAEGTQIIENDPHIWLSPSNAKIMLENIARGLITIDPENADYYEANFDAYLEKLSDLDKEIEDLLSPFTERTFLAYHNAFNYFAHRYNLEQIAIDEGAGITQGNILRAITQAQEHNLNYIFVTPQTDPRQAKQVAEQMGLELEIEIIDPLPSAYLEGMKDVAQKLAKEFEA